MRVASLLIIFTSIFHLSFGQYQTGGRKSLSEFTDLFTGPVPKWQPKGVGYAFLNSAGLVVRAGESTTTVVGAQNMFVWANDGNSIIYTAKDSTGNLKIFRYFLMDRTSKLVSLESNWSDFYPSVSPNDSIICYYSAKNEPFKIYYTELGITRKIDAHDQLAEYMHPKWSPQGHYLLYFKHRQPNNPTLEVIDFATKRVILSLDGNTFDFYDWSPDETEILVREQVAPVGNSKYYYGKLTRINIRSKEKFSLTERYKDLFTAVWSTTDNKIVFSANNKIFVVDSNGANLSKIYSGGNFPDVDSKGEKIIFVGNKRGIPVYEIGLDGGNLKLLEQKTFDQ
jgi:Tol biopolymer transport system component